MLRRILLIARRDFLAVVMTKPFVFGLFVLPVLLGGGFFVQVLNQKRDNAEVRKVAVLDRSQAAGPYIIQAAQQNNRRDLYDKLTGRQAMPQYEFESIPAAPGDAEPQLLALSDRVRRRELYGFVDIPPNVLQNPSPPSAGARFFFATCIG